MFNDDQEEPAAVLVASVNGQEYDIRNIPGFKRKQLIDSGAIKLESFVQADNMPGAKLKKMRDRFKLSNNMTTGDKPVSEIDITTLEVGTLVEYRKVATEVKKINVKKELVSISHGGKTIWVNVAKLKPVDIPPVDEE
jgi:hypothetical protein